MPTYKDLLLLSSLVTVITIGMIISHVKINERLDILKSNVFELQYSQTTKSHWYVSDEYYVKNEDGFIKVDKK